MRIITKKTRLPLYFDFGEDTLGKLVVPADATVDTRIFVIQVKTATDYVTHHYMAVGFVKDNEIISDIVSLSNTATDTLRVLELHHIAGVLV
jgi:hypothetical protein